MARFDFFPTPLDGVTLVQRKALGDQRGFLSRLYCADEFASAGFFGAIAQINHTLTQAAGTVRGMHFQSPPSAEAKLVSCLQGEIFDVAVDLRQGSPTFLNWYGEVLSAGNHKSLLIPEGFAHGFQALTDGCELVYLHSAAYSPAAEGALNVADPRIGIVWPLPIRELSERDMAHPFIATNYQGIHL